MDGRDLQIAGGRFILGLGLTHQAVTEGMWGIPYDKPVRRMREYLDAVQPLLAGEVVNVVGETVSDRLDELAALGVDEVSAVVFDGSPEVRERTRSLLLRKDS